MKKSGKRKRKNSKAPDSQLEPNALALVSRAGENRTLAACINRPRTEDKYIPREIIFNILLLLPASLLQDIMRLVCKQWNAIITDPLFVRAHLLHSLSSPGTGFLVQDEDQDDAKLKRAFYFHTHTIDATRQYSWSEHKLPFRATILGSCNGLVLLQNAFIRRELFVVNLVTKANISLPPLNLAGVRNLRRPFTALAFAPNSGQYKVVYVSFVSKNKRPPYVYPGEEHYYCAIYEVKVMVHTIAVDKTWRAIDDCKGVTMSNDAKKTLMSQPLSSARGYIYWFHHRHNYGFALDIDAETMYQFAGPKDYVMDCNATHSIKMDTGVGMMHLQNHGTCWKVWEMIEPKTGTWGRAMDFDAPRMYSTLDSHFNLCNVIGAYIPLLISLKTGEHWFYCRVNNKYVLFHYNWKTGDIWSPRIEWPSYVTLPHLHVNSLLSLKNL